MTTRITTLAATLALSFALAGCTSLTSARTGIEFGVGLAVSSGTAAVVSEVYSDRNPLSQARKARNVSFGVLSTGALIAIISYVESVRLELESQYNSERTESLITDVLQSNAE